MKAIRQWLARRRARKTFNRTLKIAEKALNAEMKRLAKDLQETSRFIHGNYNVDRIRTHYENLAAEQHQRQREVVRAYQEWVTQSYTAYHEMLKTI